MKLAPLQLTDYWSTYLRVEANPDYKPAEHASVPLDTLEITSGIQAGKDLENPEENGTQWSLQLTVEQLVPKDTACIPYFFKLVMQGQLRAIATFPKEKLEMAVRANGPAMLFGAAREIIRASTSRGPFPAVMIPSTNFLNIPGDSAKKKSPSKKASRKVTPKKTAPRKAVKKAAKKAVRKKPTDR